MNTEKEVRLVGYKTEGKIYWVSTDRHDLTAEQVPLVYKLRCDIERFYLVEETPSGLSLDCP